MGKIIDEYWRIGGKVSVVDIFAALVIIIIIVMVVMVLMPNHTVADGLRLQPDTFELTYTILIPSLIESHARLIRQGDVIFATDTGHNIGRIANIELLPATRAATLIDGTFVIANIEGHVDVELTVIAQATAADGRFFIDGSFEIFMYSENRLHTRYNEFLFSIITSICTEY